MTIQGATQSGYDGGGYVGDCARDHPVVARPSLEADRVAPVGVPEGVSEPHPVGHTVAQYGGADSGAGEGLPQDALPSIREAAVKVGGFKRLSEIAGQLGQDDEGQQPARLVLAPLLPQVGSSKRWLVSPDGNLWLLPWGALTLPDGSYALEKHPISYLTSGRDFCFRCVRFPCSRSTPSAT
jgi:CHAT domain